MNKTKKKLTLMLFCLFVFAFQIKCFAQITLSANNQKIVNVMQMLEKNSGYNFFYSNDFIDLDKKITINVKNESIQSVLDKMFQGTNIHYKIEDNKQIMLTVSGKQEQNTGNKKTITGYVVDDKGEALIGVSVKSNQGNIGTITDVNGHFIIEVPTPSTLTFSYISYGNQEIRVREKTAVNVVMKESSHVIDEVVVTALGMKREEKALGYAVTKIDGSSLTDAPSGNWLDALSGKAAGITFNKANTGPSGSIRVTLRGESSFDLNNSGALFVVDGVPISNKMTAGGADAHNVNAGDMPVDFGNGSADINPEDIENVTVLKGASATALYGSRAANGAIIITTKSGKSSRYMGITFSSSIAVDEVSRWPSLQNSYGSGGQGKNAYYSFGSTEDGASTHSSQSWGPKLDGQLYYQYYQESTGLNLDQDGNRIRSPWLAFNNWFNGFFQKGTTYTNTVTMEGGNGKGNNMRLSFTDRRNEWILENTGFADQRLALSAKQELNKFISLEAKANYYHKSSDNLPAVGYGPSSVMYALLTTSPNINADWYRNYWIIKGEEQDNRLNTNADNPFFTLYEQLNAQNRDRVFGNVNATINLHKKVSLMIRSGIDMNQEERSYSRPWSSKKTPNGEYREQIVHDMEINSDFLLKYEDKFGKDDAFGITVNFGGNNMVSDYVNENLRAENLKLPGYYYLANATDRLYATKNSSKKVINSLYGLAQLSYKNFLYIDITGRNDWSSTLPLNNNSYFYPSVSSSLLFHELFQWNNSYLTFAKLRLSYAKVGNDTRPYQLDRLYEMSSFGGSYTTSTIVPDPNLKPEMTGSYEIGTEIKLFSNKLGFDFSYYNTENTNLIVSMPIDPSSGALYTKTNAGKIRNRGMEFSAYYTPVSLKDFKWSLNMTWSKNTTKVLQLADGISSWIISKGPRGQVEARVGGTMSALYGSGFKRAPEGSFVTNSDGTTTNVSGKILYDSGTGYPIVDTENSQYIGDVAPDWKGSLGTSFKYKSVSLKILFDMQKGGKVYSLSNNKLCQFGKMSNTLAGRYDGLVGDGVVANADGTYSYNTKVTNSISEYYATYYGIDNVEANMVSTEYVKLREVSLEYQLPQKWLDKLKYFKSLSFAVYGRDLYCWTKYPIFDPEVATLNADEITPGFETAQFPSTRTFGASIRVSF